MATQISRDPFARETLVRVKCNSSYATCDWCGQRRDKGLFIYGIESDGGRTDWDNHRFCSVNCYRTYHS